MKLFNSLSRRKEDFRPLQDNEVRLYSCGPTVYDHAHLGNLRAYIVADVLQRSLRHVGGFKTRWVMNITDIDDKMIDRIKQATPDLSPHDAVRLLADRYIELFKTDAVQVNIEVDQLHLVRATDNIESMQELIRDLVQQELAYVSAGSVYFSIETYRKQGHKYGQLVDLDYQAQARVTNDQDQKEGVADFALWKATKRGEPSWDFQLGDQNLPGRPGWHIECSAMSVHELGRPFDIHTGGVDLKFPHHENEIAQEMGELARFFVHNEHLLINGQKMSKSLNNFYTLEEVGEPLAFRYLVLQAHYRSQMNYTDEAYRAAIERLHNLRSYVDQMVLKDPAELPVHDDTGNTDKFEKAFTQVINDDINTPEALAAFSLIEGKSYSQQTLSAIKRADQVLGLSLVEDATIPDEVRDLIKRYEAARTKADYDVSDELRAQIKDLGFEVADTKQEGTLVHRRR